MKSIEDIVLTTGNHLTREDGLCVMEAVAWVAGETHTDMPKCVSPVISRYCQGLNDEGNEEVRERLKPYIYKVIGTASPELDLKRAFIVADYAVRVFAEIDVPRVVDRITAQAAAKAANAAANAAAADIAYAAEKAAVHAAYAAAAAHAVHAVHAARAAANAVYAFYAEAAADAAHAASVTAQDKWDQAFKCLDDMLWPVE
jgi:hypothetical protein